MQALGFGFWEDWALNDKVTFNMFTRIISVNEGVTTIDVKADIYSASKRWLIVDDNNKIGQVVRVIGGDATIVGQKAGDIYFLVNGWLLQIDLSKTALIGSVFSDNYDTPLIDFAGTPTKQSLVSSLVTSTITTTNVVTGDIADIPDNTQYLEKIVWIDTEQIEIGNGSQAFPFNNLTDAVDYAETQGIKHLRVYADIVLDRKLKNFKVEGVGNPTIDCNGQDLKKSEFSYCKLQGTYSGIITARECKLLTGFSLNGSFESCGLAGDLVCIGGSDVLVAGCKSTIPGLTRPSISLNGAGTTQLSVRAYSGGLDIRDCNTATDNCTVELVAGSVSLATSCSAGNIVVRGVGYLQNNTTGTIVTNESLSTYSIWNMNASLVDNIGSLGYIITNKLLTITKFIGLK